MNKKSCLYLLFSMILMCLFLGGCAESGEKSEPITDIRQLDGQTIGVMTGSTFDQYTDEFNQFLAGLKSDGTLEEPEDVRFGLDESRKTVEAYESLPASNGTVELALKLENAPFAYTKDNQVVGYDVDIAARFCKAYGYGLNINSVESDVFLSDVGSGKYDMGVSGFTVTEDRAEKVYFSEPNYTGGIVAVVAGNSGGALHQSLRDFSGKKRVDSLRRVYEEIPAQNSVGGSGYDHTDGANSLVMKI